MVLFDRQSTATYFSAPYIKADDHDAADIEAVFLQLLV